MVLIYDFVLYCFCFDSLCINNCFVFIFFPLAYMFGCIKDRFLYRAWPKMLMFLLLFCTLAYGNFDWAGGICSGQLELIWSKLGQGVVGYWQDKNELNDVTGSYYQGCKWTGQWVEELWSESQKLGGLNWLLEGVVHLEMKILSLFTLCCYKPV